jgi:hypothetical protein
MLPIKLTVLNFERKEIPNRKSLRNIAFLFRFLKETEEELYT